MENKKKKIAVYITNKEYDTLLQSVINSNKTLTAYCKEKIFSVIQSSTNEDFLKNHILRQFEDLLYLLISQNNIDKTKINEDTIKNIIAIFLSLCFSRFCLTYSGNSRKLSVFGSIAPLNVPALYS